MHQMGVYLWRCRQVLFLLVIQVWGIWGQTWQQETLLDVNARMERILLDNIVPFWEKTIDRMGGYALNHGANGVWRGPSPKSIVSQARMVWFFAYLYNSENYSKPKYLDMSAQGFRFLKDHMWDDTYGGFFWEVDPRGRSQLKKEKSIFGQAYALYGLVEYIQASGDPEAWSLASQLSTRLHDHAHDPLHGGFFEQLTRDWTHGPGVGAGPTDHNGYRGVPLDLKTVNTQLALLEAFTSYHTACRNANNNRRRTHLGLPRDDPQSQQGPAPYTSALRTGTGNQGPRGRDRGMSGPYKRRNPNTIHSRDRLVQQWLAGARVGAGGGRARRSLLQLATPARQGNLSVAMAPEEQGHPQVLASQPPPCPVHASGPELLQELVRIQSDTIIRHPLGCFTDLMERDWLPLKPGRQQKDGRVVSFGHNLANVWTLAEAAEEIEPGSSSQLLPVFRAMFGYTLAHGVDTVYGGVFQKGPLGEDADDRTKMWWAQAEALVAALYMYKLTTEQQYLDFLLKTLEWVEKYQVDWANGEWHARVNWVPSRESGISGSTAGVWKPDFRVRKAGTAKTAYHTGRAMLKCLHLLRAWPGFGNV